MLVYKVGKQRVLYTPRQSISLEILDEFIPKLADLSREEINFLAKNHCRRVGELGTKELEGVIARELYHRFDLEPKELITLYQSPSPFRIRTLMTIEEEFAVSETGERFHLEDLDRRICDLPLPGHPSTSKSTAHVGQVLRSGSVDAARAIDEVGPATIRKVLEFTQQRGFGFLDFKYAYLTPEERAPYEAARAAYETNC